MTLPSPVLAPVFAPILAPVLSPALSPAFPPALASVFPSALASAPSSASASGGLGPLLAGAANSESAQHAVGYPSLFLLVLIGALVPVVPTGALVSSAGVVAIHQSTAPLSSALVFVTASLAAFLGDTALFWLGRRGMDSRNGSRWLEAIRARAPEERLTQAQERLEAHGVAVLVLSRLIPAGRLPVMLACLLADWRLHGFVRGSVPACLVWAATYQLIGVLGGALFPEPWQGVVAAVALTVLISVTPGLWRRVRSAGGPGD